MAIALPALAELKRPACTKVIASLATALASEPLVKLATVVASYTLLATLVPVTVMVFGVMLKTPLL